MNTVIYKHRPKQNATLKAKIHVSRYRYIFGELVKRYTEDYLENNSADLKISWLLRKELVVEAKDAMIFMSKQSLGMVMC